MALLFRCLRCGLLHTGWSEHTLSVSHQAEPEWTEPVLAGPSALWRLFSDVPLWKTAAFLSISCDFPANIVAMFLWSAPDRKETEVSLTLGLFIAQEL